MAFIERQFTQRMSSLLTRHVVSGANPAFALQLVHGAAARREYPTANTVRHSSSSALSLTVSQALRHCLRHTPESSTPLTAIFAAAWRESKQRNSHNAGNSSNDKSDSKSGADSSARREYTMSSGGDGEHRRQRAEEELEEEVIDISRGMSAFHDEKEMEDEREMTEAENDASTLHQKEQLDDIVSRFAAFTLLLVGFAEIFPELNTMTVEFQAQFTEFATKISELTDELPGLENTITELILKGSVAEKDGSTGGSSPTSSTNVDTSEIHDSIEPTHNGLDTKQGAELSVTAPSVDPTHENRHGYTTPKLIRWYEGWHQAQSKAAKDKTPILLEAVLNHGPVAEYSMEKSPVIPPPEVKQTSQPPKPAAGEPQASKIRFERPVDTPKKSRENQQASTNSSLAPIVFRKKDFDRLTTEQLVMLCRECQIPAHLSDGTARQKIDLIRAVIKHFRDAENSNEAPGMNRLKAYLLIPTNLPEPTEDDIGSPLIASPASLHGSLLVEEPHAVSNLDSPSSLSSRHDSEALAPKPTVDGIKLTSGATTAEKCGKQSPTPRPPTPQLSKSLVKQIILDNSSPETPTPKHSASGNPFVLARNSDGAESAPRTIFDKLMSSSRARVKNETGDQEPASQVSTGKNGGSTRKKPSAERLYQSDRSDNSFGFDSRQSSEVPAALKDWEESKFNFEQPPSMSSTISPRGSSKKLQHGWSSRPQSAYQRGGIFQSAEEAGSAAQSSMHAGPMDSAAKMPLTEEVASLEEKELVKEMGSTKEIGPAEEQGLGEGMAAAEGLSPAEEAVSTREVQTAQAMESAGEVKSVNHPTVLLEQSPEEGLGHNEELVSVQETNAGEEVDSTDTEFVEAAEENDVFYDAFEHLDPVLESKVPRRTLARKSSKKTAPTPYQTRTRWPKPITQFLDRIAARKAALQELEDQKSRTAPPYAIQSWWPKLVTQFLELIAAKKDDRRERENQQMLSNGQSMRRGNSSTPIKKRRKASRKRVKKNQIFHDASETFERSKGDEQESVTQITQPSTTEGQDRLHTIREEQTTVVHRSAEDPQTAHDIFENIDTDTTGRVSIRIRLPGRPPA